MSDQEMICREIRFNFCIGDGTYDFYRVGQDGVTGIFEEDGFFQVEFTNETVEFIANVHHSFYEPE